jgi:hypothetical protein
MAKKFRNFGLFGCQKVPFPKSFGTFSLFAERTVRGKQKVGAKSPHTFHFLRNVPFGLTINYGILIKTLLEMHFPYRVKR